MPSSTHHAPFVTLATRCSQFAQARHLQAWLKHAKTRSLAQTTTACASDSIHHHRIIVLGHFQFQDGISHTAPALTKDGELDSLFSHDLIGYDQARPGDASVAQSQPWPNQVCQVLKKEQIGQAVGQASSLQKKQLVQSGLCPHPLTWKMAGAWRCSRFLQASRVGFRPMFVFRTGSFGVGSRCSRAS